MEDFIQKLQAVHPYLAYVILFLSAYIENIFPPIPGDTVTLAGAYLVGIGLLNFWGVLVATTLGSILGFMTIFFLAYWLEWKIIEKYQPRWVNKTHIDRVEGWFRKYGYWIILANRFLSGARSVISFIAGLSKMRTGLVFLFALLSCFFWNGMIIFLGALVGKNWHTIVEWLKLYNKIVVAVLLAALGGYLVYHFWIRPRRNRPSS